MARIDEQTKRQRKDRVQLIVAGADGLRESEIAAQAGLEQRTANNYLRELEYEGQIFKDGLLWHGLNVHGTKLRSFELSPEEAYTLYLAARLLVKQHDKRNEPAETALLKLAKVLSSGLGVGSEIAQAATELAQRPMKAGYQSVFRTVVQGYLYRRQLDLVYRPYAGKPFSTVFSPYLLEPSAIGFTTYAIGHSSRVGALRSYRLDRIESAQLKRDPYQIPADFPGLDILRNAWSIMIGETTTRVVLRFSPAVKERVLETRWHLSQDSMDDPDQPGYLRWWVEVADTTDMKPWVRSWGADCEVLEPAELRNALVFEVRQLSQVYSLAVTQSFEPKYFAHSRPDLPETEWQLLKDHLVATGELAAERGKAAGIAELARVAGLLHDIGKYSPEFQARLRGSSQRVDHATAGAREIMALFPTPPNRNLAELISYCIAGHHTGLPDYGSMGDVDGDGTLLARREKKTLKDYSAYRTEIDVNSLVMPPLRVIPARFRFGDSKPVAHSGFSVSFLTRMLFSVLVDADWLDTERFMDHDEKPRGHHAAISQLTEQFNQYLLRFDDPQTPINRQRTETLHTCVAKASERQGYFRLTVPTGGGKTLASMAFALNHALTHDLERIIYVIPFTSIIEQNAAVFREALGPLGPENILEHHSNYDWRRQTSDDEANEVQEKLKLAAENWDVPIVVTTNVQFFESLFASKKSQARKLHNTARSVIIFDEAQMLPLPYLKPCLMAVQELVNNYGCSVVFCTATQPSLERFFPADVQYVDLAPNPQALFDFYRRVQVKNLGKLPDDELINKLRAQSQALCIVNTRRHARGLFDLLNEDGAFHLSTLMCPAHRKETLKEIRQRLKAGQPCRVVSTQVMEAGIDVDFPIGFRALAGLDSIIQAAGRVNREMRQVSGDIFVFTPQTEFIKRTPKFIEQTAAVAEATLRRFADDPASVAAIEAYYTMLYTLHGERSFDDKGIVSHFDKGPRQLDFDFKTAAEKFKLIDEDSVTVFIPYDAEARGMCQEL